MLGMAVLCGTSSSSSAQGVGQTSVVWTTPLDADYSGFGDLIDDTFRFEAGYFVSGFTPTPENTTSWKPNWRKVQSSFFRGNQKRIDSKFNATQGYHAQGQRAYVWGFSGNKWILLRHTSWTWPTVSSPPSPPLVWDITKANTVILGSIRNATLLFSDAGQLVSPPDTTWDEWREQFLATGSAQKPDSDEDLDAIPNVLEFVMGSDPRKYSPYPKLPTEIVTVGTNRHLQISIPRRIDHMADLVVEVASHPAGPWLSGSQHTSVVASSPSTLIVRDNLPISPTYPQRFMRMRIVSP